MDSEELRKLLAEATPRPWCAVFKTAEREAGIEVYYIEEEFEDDPPLAAVGDTGNASTNTDLIVEAVNSLEELLNERDRLLERVNSLEKEPDPFPKWVPSPEAELQFAYEIYRAFNEYDGRREKLTRHIESIVREHDRAVASHAKEQATAEVKALEAEKDKLVSDADVLHKFRLRETEAKQAAERRAETFAAALRLHGITCPALDAEASKDES